jgi:hypothetical protein
MLKIVKRVNKGRNKISLFHNCGISYGMTYSWMKEKGDVHLQIL